MRPTLCFIHKIREFYPGRRGNNGEQKEVIRIQESRFGTQISSDNGYNEDSRWADRQRKRQGGMQIDRQPIRQGDRDAERYIDREAHRQVGREAGRQTGRDMQAERGR